MERSFHGTGAKGVNRIDMKTIKNLIEAVIRVCSKTFDFVISMRLAKHHGGGGAVGIWIATPYAGDQTNW